MQIHEITEGILKGVKAVASPITGTLGTVKNAAKFAGQAVTKPGMNYFADKILNAAGIHYDPLIRGANADELAAAADAKAAADKAAKDAAKKAGGTAPTDTTPAATGTPPAATTNTTSPTTTNVPPGFNYNTVTKLPGVSTTTAPSTTNVPPGFNYNNVTKMPGVNAPKTAPATAPVTPTPVTTPQQSKIGVGQINKIIPSLRTRDLLSVKKNVDNTLAVKQKQPEPAATAVTNKPQWTGRQKNLTKQQRDYINAIQRNAK